MSPEILRHSSLIDADVIDGVTDGRVSGRPFIVYAQHAVDILAGFAVVAEMRLAAAILRGSDDPTERAAALTVPGEHDLLRMMYAVGKVMQDEAGHLNDWGHERLKDGAR